VITLLLSLVAHAVCAPDCNHLCDPVMNEVCGSDGVTYRNRCILDTITCRTPSVQFAYEGPCKEERADNDCQTLCDPTKAEVCATNGQTYRNRCILDRVTRCSDASVKFDHDGPCEKVTVAAPTTATTKQDCDVFCDPTKAEVCGTDGKTYRNRCILDKIICGNPSLQFAHDGPCPSPTTPGTTTSACDIFCDPTKAEVCASDGQTYRNRCILDKVICSHPNIQFVHDGPCPTPPPMTTGAVDPTQNCTWYCPAARREVCASNGKTYRNKCVLDSASCNDSTVRFAYDGACNEPCLCEGSRYSFTVYLSQIVRSPKHSEDIVFDRVQHDRWSAYNNVSGQWRAPVSGIYLFSVHLWAFVPNTDRFYASLNVDGVNSAWTYTPLAETPDGEFMVVQMTVQRQLTLGQNVTVRVQGHLNGFVQVTSELHDMESWFSGHLVEK